MEFIRGIKTAVFITLCFGLFLTVLFNNEAAEASQKIYYSINTGSSGSISRVNVDGTSNEIVIGTGSPYFIAIDSGNGDLYYAELNTTTPTAKIYRIEGGTGSPVEVFDFKSDLPPKFAIDDLRDMALDSKNGKIYYSINGCDLSTGKYYCYIKRMDTDGSNLETVYCDSDDNSILVSPGQMALDEDNGILYFTDSYRTKKGIYKASVTGISPITNASQLVYEIDLSKLNFKEIILDSSHEKLYYSADEGGEYYIKRVNTDGMNPETVYEDDAPIEVEPGQMVVDEDGGILYFTDSYRSDGKGIYKASVTGDLPITSASERIYEFNPSNLADMALQFEVIAAPVLDKNETLTVNEDEGPAIITNGLLQASDPKFSAAEMTFTVNTAPTGGVLKKSGTYLAANDTFTQSDIDSNNITYTPKANNNGSDSFAFTVSNTAGKKINDTFSITINAVNDEPVFNKGPDQTVLEDAGQQTVNGWATNISSGPPNEAGQNLTFDVTNDNNSLFFAQPSVAGDGTLTYTPADDANGSAVVTISLRDDGGTANGGDDISPEQSFTINVTPVNDPPYFTKGPNQAVSANTGQQTVNGWATNIFSGPDNEAGQILTFAVTNDNNSLFSVQPSVTGKGTLTYTPAADANGSSVVAVRLRDDGGTADDGKNVSPDQSFTIKVLGEDGGGQMTVSPTEVTAGKQGVILIFTYTAGSGGMDDGTVTISVPAGWSAPSLISSEPGYSTTAAGTLSINGRTITAEGLTLAEGSSFSLYYGDKSGGGPGATAADITGASVWTSQSRAVTGGKLLDLKNSPTITLSPRPTDPVKSSVLADPVNLPANGTAVSAVTAILRDEINNPLGGHTVTLDQGGGSSDISPANAVSNSDGQAVFTVKSVKAETVTYTAVDTTDNITITQQAEVRFTPGVEVSPTGISIGEGESSQYTVVLGSSPADIVTVSVYGDSRLEIIPEKLTFSSGNWNMPQTVTVTAVDDNIHGGSKTIAIRHNAASSDKHYNGIAISDVAVNITDNDIPGISLSQTGGSTDVAEGGTADTYSMVLNTKPADTVTVSVYGDSRLEIMPEKLTFSSGNWNMPQTVTVTAVDDNIPGGSKTIVIRHNAASSDKHYNGIAISDVAVNITDNDIPGISLSQTGGSTDVAEGGTADTYSMVLNTKPADTVTVSVYGDSQLEVTPKTLAFAVGDWNKPQTVVVTAIDDVLIEGVHTGTVRHAVYSNASNYLNIMVNNLIVTILDNDLSGNANLKSLIISSGTLTPGFDPGITIYSVSVPNSVVSTTVTSVAEENQAIVTVNGTPVFSGHASFPINLDVGNNIITVVVTAPNTSTKTYTITVIRAASSGRGGGGSSELNPVRSANGSASVNPETGGEIGLDGDASLIIPAGALRGTAGVEVTVQKADNPPAAPSGFMFMGKVYEFRMDGSNHYNFDKPVTLTFTFDPDDLAPGEKPEVFYYDETIGQWVSLGGTVSGNTITITVTHFTKFAVMVKEKLLEEKEQSPEPESSVTLTDIIGHWAEPSIKQLTESGAIKGYPDGTFKPDKTITRAEFVTVLVKAFNLELKDGKEFKDTADHWAKDYITAAAAAGIINGYDENTFGPDDLITREQMAVMTVKAAKVDKPAGNCDFADNSKISAWARDAVAAATAKNIISGYPDNTFRPQQNATRAEAVTAIVRALSSLNFSN